MMTGWRTCETTPCFAQRRSAPSAAMDDRNLAAISADADPHAELRVLAPRHPSLRDRAGRAYRKAGGERRIGWCGAIAGLLAAGAVGVAALGFSPSYVGAVGLAGLVFAVLNLGEGR